MLLTSLLVLAMLASATLVFTSRVELLRLAVILSLWAAVAAAFVTVIYRRQSDLDKARARDMKFVYDLQLDREISARREYELSVESHLRRTLSREIRAEAADEMSGLRTELAALRSQLEVMLGADLGHRPALESDRLAPMAAMPMPVAPDRVESSRVTVVAEAVTTYVSSGVTAENPIIDVPEEPLIDPAAGTVAAAAAGPPPVPPVTTEYQGRRRRPVDTAPLPAPPREPPPPDAFWRATDPAAGRHSSGDGWRAGPTAEQQPPRGRHWVPADDEPAPAGRHRGSDVAREEPVVDEVTEDSHGQHSAGQSFSDLLARFQVARPTSGGGRRRRED